MEVQDNNMQEEYQIHKQTLNVWEMSCSGSLIGHLRMFFGCDFMLLLKRDLIFPKIMPSIMPSIAGVYNSLIGHLRLCHDRGVGQTYYQDSTIPGSLRKYTRSPDTHSSPSPHKKTKASLQDQVPSNREATRTTTTSRSKASSYILLLCPSSVQAEGAKGASSQPAKHE